MLSRRDRRSTVAARTSQASRLCCCVMLLLSCADSDAPKGFDSPRSHPSETANGKACKVSADCVGSPAAQEYENIRCISELYCLEGSCYFECRSRCFPARTDENPCEDRGLCSSTFPFCTRMPVSCKTVEECPTYLPNGEGGVWECSSGICEFPGYEYQAH